MPDFSPTKGKPRWPRLISFVDRLFGASDESGALNGAAIRQIADSGLFDAAFYRAQMRPTRPAGTPGPHQQEKRPNKQSRLIAHYLREGAAQWLSPSRQFDTGYYLDTNPQVAQSAENPLLHYIRSGHAAGLATIADADLWTPGDTPSVPWPLAVEQKGLIYLVPVYRGDRNTTRYRARHLVELADEAAVQVIDWKGPPDDFFPALAAGAPVILQRLPLTGDTEVFVHRVRAAARLVAYDIDDQIFDATELEDWRIAGLGASPAQYARCMALADHFLVSTTALRAKVERRFRRPAHVVSNVLGRETLARSAAAAPRAPGGPFVVGYGSGSHTHDDDLNVILPALRRFLGANPDAAFHAVGPMTFPAELKTEFGDRVRHSKAVPWRTLPDVLAEFTVQVIPLVDCPFNRRKSHVRFLEAAAVGVPSVVSAVGEPACTTLDGVTGLVCANETDAWFTALQTLHDDPVLRSRIAAAAKTLVTSFMTTDAPFARDRAHAVLDDLHLGVLRDRFGIVVTAADPDHALAEVKRTTALPWTGYVASPIAAPAENVLAMDLGPTPLAAMGLVTERFVAIVGDRSPEALWDLRMVQAAKALPAPGWLSADLGIAEGPAAPLRGGIAMVRTARGGHGPFLIPASSGFDASLPSVGDSAPAAGSTRLNTGIVPIATSVQPCGSLSACDVAIKICTPMAIDENVWGDTHFARGLSRALTGLGYDVRIDKREDWHVPQRGADVVIHLFGVVKYVPDTAAINVLWVISHPQELDAAFVRGFDLVFCASEAISERVRQLVPDKPVATLLQATDETVFFPDRSAVKDLDIVFIGNSRKVNRKAVHYAVEGGFDLALWGTRWEKFVDPRIIRGTSLRSDEVAAIYRRARVVLNDHWSDQNAEGLVNNRVFDVLACDTMVLSDANPGLATLLNSPVPTFTDSADFATRLRALLDDPERDAKAAALGAEVRRNHTFAQRAQVIHEAIERLRIERAALGT